jgi:stage III sporulation protein AH
MHTGGVPDQNKEQCGREQELKNMFKRNQVMITALAIMIAVAGYLNFAGTKVGEEELADVGASAGQESDMEALLELSDEDGKEDIASLDSDTEDVAAENFLNENMQTISDQDVAALTDDAADSAEEALEGEIPGEAVYTNSGSVSSLSGARLLKEQTRAKNKETLLEIINNANIAENQKQEAVDEMIALTDLTERETAAEILLETRGYADAVVTITDESADVVVGMSVLSDAQCAQIEDIVARKTGIAAQNIVINPLSR